MKKFLVKGSTMLEALMLCFLIVPVWAGGQAMACYRDGGRWRAHIGFFCAIALNLALALVIVWIVRCDPSFVTLLRALGI